MNLHIKTFDQLSTQELYEILRLRCAVFVVEQNCPYQDVDGRDDFAATHVFYEENGEVIAYLRCYYPEGESCGSEAAGGTLRLGRVISARRGIGLGAKVLSAGIAYAKEQLRPRRIYIEAQCYAIPFYEKAGFRTCGDEFLEDGIPHVPMMLEL